MWKRILLQWAGVGILSLFGWGADVMPSNTSWIPSIIIWSVAFIWLIITILYWFKRRKSNKHKEPDKEKGSVAFLARRGSKIDIGYSIIDGYDKVAEADEQSEVKLKKSAVKKKSSS